MNKKHITWIIVIALAAILVSGVCVLMTRNNTDFASAAQLEAALNDGKDVEGMTAKVKVNRISTDGLAGILGCTNFWAGEHLNLLYYGSIDGIEIGDKLTIRIDEFYELDDHWFAIIKLAD